MAKTFTVSYPDKLYEQIQKQAEIENKNPSDIVRESVNDYLKGEKKISISVQYKKGFYDQIKKRAKQEGVNLTDIIRKAVKIYLILDFDTPKTAGEEAFLESIKQAVEKL